MTRMIQFADELAKDPCDGTDCPAGCCLGVYDWFCCADFWCAPTEAECVFISERLQ